MFFHQERIKQSDKSNSEKLAALKKLVETIKTDVSNNSKLILGIVSRIWTSLKLKIANGDRWL